MQWIIIFLWIHKSNWVFQVCFKLGIDANASIVSWGDPHLFIADGAESNMLINYWLVNDDWSFIALLVLLLYISNADMHLCWRIIINYRPGISFGAADMHIHYSWTSDPYDVRGVCLDCRYSWQFTIQSNVPTAFS